MPIEYSLAPTSLEYIFKSLSMEGKTDLKRQSACEAKVKSLQKPFKNKKRTMGKNDHATMTGGSTRSSKGKRLKKRHRMTKGSPDEASAHVRSEITSPVSADVVGKKRKIKKIGMESKAKRAK